MRGQIFSSPHYWQRGITLPHPHSTAAVTQLLRSSTRSEGRRMGFESKKTASRCTAEAERGTHMFEIVGYSLKKGIGARKFVRLGTFTVGGLVCAVYFFPDGFTEGTENCVFVLKLIRRTNAAVRVSYELRLLKKECGLPGLWSGMREPSVFNSSTRLDALPIPRNLLELEESGYIKDDDITIECVLMVIKESQLFEIKVPPSELSQHLGELLESKEGADVTFSVGGETFAAHKIVLAMRSPVFKAELCGKMIEARMPCVTIEDMQPIVFSALLHFIYTDSLPNMSNCEVDDDTSEMIQHLLVAADRYAMDRLKLLCQNILAKNIDVETVATTFALADQHNCDKLKQVCIEFIVSSNVIDAVVATKGYAGLKRTCPSVLIEMLEKAIKFPKA